MKITKDGAIFATLELALDLTANQRVMNRIILHYVTRDDEEYQAALASLNHQVSTELEVLRARLLRHSNTSIDDLLNGTADI